MSPLTLRRYRAERLLRLEFVGMQARVIEVVAGRLRGYGVSLDESELEACYAVAWQGLYMAVLEGQEIANPAGWLVLVTFRRAIEEQRSRARLHRVAEAAQAAGADAGVALLSGGASEQDGDLAGELDDRARLRHLFEGLRARLSEREREAAVLCYLQGLSRADAAARMGVSEARMRKLMDGSGSESPGVASKVGALVRSIRDGAWCEEQSSLMRALAFGILDPDGERYRLALAHRGECPACRAYVVSLRGLAAALPPTLLPWSLGGGVLARIGEGGHAGAAGAASGATGSAASAGPGALGGAATATGAVGSGGAAAGGSWLLAGGPLGAKLAVGCLLAAGVGAGCAVLEGGLLAKHARAPVHKARGHAPRTGARAQLSALASVGSAAQAPLVRASASTAAGSAQPTPSARASREFGIEQHSATGTVGATGLGAVRPRQLAKDASAGAGGATTVAGANAPSAPASSGSQSSGAATKAAREFSPG
jgi:DNA-directed RNA polymerase specialized sigma24 family protein